MTLDGRDAFGENFPVGIGDEHFLLDMHDGQVQAVRTPGIYPSTEPWLTPFFAVLALVVWYVDRQRGQRVAGGPEALPLDD